jgi:hypothetical protein
MDAPDRWLAAGREQLCCIRCTTGYYAQSFSEKNRQSITALSAMRDRQRKEVAVLHAKSCRVRATLPGLTPDSN